jgi:hypothetical protein
MDPNIQTTTVAILVFIVATRIDREN